MSGRRILTVRDFGRAARQAEAEGDSEALAALAAHHPYADHCGGYEVLAWPCPEVAPAVRRLTGG